MWAQSTTIIDSFVRGRQREREREREEKREREEVAEVYLALKN